MSIQIQLTSRQQQVFKILRDAITHRGIVPTIRELQEELCFKSSRAVVRHLLALEKKGYIKREGGARGVRILKFKQKGKTRSDVCYLPLVGHVAAGLPMLAEENVEEWVPVPAGMRHCDRTFLLKAKGHSMTGAHILDGDLLAVCPEHEADEGDIVVALIGSEATVKRFYKRNGHIELKPENSRYKTLTADPSEVTLQGKVVGVLRIKKENNA